MIRAYQGKIEAARTQAAESAEYTVSATRHYMEGAAGLHTVPPGLITGGGEVTDKGTEQFLRDFIEAFEVFVARVLTVLPPERLGATG